MNAVPHSRRQGVAADAAVLLLCVTVALGLAGASALAASGPLDGKTFVGESGEKGQTKSEAEQILRSRPLQGDQHGRRDDLRGDDDEREGGEDRLEGDGQGRDAGGHARLEQAGAEGHRVLVKGRLRK